MSIPGFNAELSLRATEDTYRASAVLARSFAVRVLPMLDDDVCGKCETVGRFGGISGVGRRSCCRKTWR